TIQAGYFEWTATGTSERYFHEIKQADALMDAPIARIREVARLNWHHKAQHEASNRFAQLLLCYLIAESGNPLDKVALFYTQFAQHDRKNAFASQKSESLLTEDFGALEMLLFLPKIETEFSIWAEGWYVSLRDQLALIHLLLGRGRKERLPYHRLLGTHRTLRDQFLKDEKELVNKVWVEIEFCRHLIWSGETKEAIQTLEDTLEVLPDESLSDLLPPADLDLTQKASGQILRIQILDLIVEAKGEKNAKKTLAELARLQPLIPNRVSRWKEYAKSSDQERAETLEAILNPEGLTKAEAATDETAHFNTLSDKFLEKEVRHPASREKGIRQVLEKWLAEVPRPDTGTMKAFAQSLNESEHASIQQTLVDTRQALGMEAVNCFVAHGANHVGVQGYEDSPSFLVIGADHLNTESPFFLSGKEWQFALAAEMAHLKFGHVRITSNDLWVGAKEKGLFALDTVLSILPGLGALGSAMKTIPQLNNVSSLLQQATRFQAIAENSQQIMQATGTALALVSVQGGEKRSQEDIQKQQLLATSRVMQLTADRVGLLLAGDLRASVRAIFLTSKRYQAEMGLAQKYGLPELLAKTDESGNLRFQELAIRLAALFAFYVTEDYTLMRKELLKS
ncbi:MAG: hypothetical protein AAF740_10480, partial [Bacteroidota bacterium]